METRRWTNPTQPQTLQIAVFLLYINAVFTALLGGIVNPIGIAMIVGQAAAGFGIANEKRWGYFLGVIVATLGIVPLVLYVAQNGVGSIIDFAFIFQAIMPVALFALLLHPQSRDYQRIWFS